MNIQMWKHYDNLRQDKNKTFLGASSILAAAVGLVLRGSEPDSGLRIALLVAIVGFLVCVLWFLLLSRNAAYVKYHRSRASTLESSMAGHATFGSGWQEFENKIPPWQRVSSNLTDRLLVAVLAAFWTSLVIYFLTTM